ncbi:MAG: EamA family transporter [Clostridia bacterium]|nr:EamA family transporter [Clostridia bacterium]
MTDYLILIGTCFLVASAGLLGGMFTLKNQEKKGSTPFYTLLFMIAALVGWGILYASNFSFEPGALLYSAIFGLCFAGVNITMLLAIRCGPVSLTNLMVQLSLITTALWGILFWNAEFSITVAVGLIFVAVALSMILYQKGKGEKITAKWMFYAFLALVFNAGCAIAQKTQQLVYQGQHGNMTMFFALVISTAVCFVWCLVDRPQTPKEVFKKTGWLPLLAGGLNALHNFCVILMASSSLSPSLIYPCLAVGGIGINAIASCILLKERLSLRQWLGIVLGAVAAVLLSR